MLTSRVKYFHHPQHNTKSNLIINSSTILTIPHAAQRDEREVKRLDNKTIWNIKLNYLFMVRKMNKVTCSSCALLSDKLFCLCGELFADHIIFCPVHPFAGRTKNRELYIFINLITIRECLCQSWNFHSYI